MERAICVTNYLTDNGIDANRITTKWVGDTQEAFTSPNNPMVNRCVTLK